MSICYHEKMYNNNWRWRCFAIIDKCVCEPHCRCYNCKNDCTKSTNNGCKFCTNCCVTDGASVRPMNKTYHICSVFGSDDNAWLAQGGGEIPIAAGVLMNLQGLLSHVIRQRNTSNYRRRQQQQPNKDSPGNNNGIKSALLLLIIIFSSCINKAGGGKIMIANFCFRFYCIPYSGNLTRSICAGVD